MKTEHLRGKRQLQKFEKGLTLNYLLFHRHTGRSFVQTQRESGELVCLFGLKNMIYTTVE